MQSNTKGMAIAGLIMGIASIVCPWLPVPFLSILALILGIVGIVLSVKVRKQNDENRGMATAGLVLSIIGVVLSGILFVCAICAACAVVGIAGAADLSSLSGLY